MTARTADRHIEALTQRIGHELFERIEQRQPGPLQFAWWDERLMRQLMSAPRLKVQAFRLMDVLPPLAGSPREIARHLKEYFSPAELGIRNGKPSGLSELTRRPFSLAGLISRMTAFEDEGSLAARGMAWAAWRSAVFMAHRFIAGSDIDAAERAIRRLRRDGLAFTIDVLGESAVSEREALEYQQIYLDLITQLPRLAQSWPILPAIDQSAGVTVPRVNVSVKMTSLFSQCDAIDPEGSAKAVKERLRPLLRQAMESSTHVHIDMEHYAIKDLTLQIVRDIFMEPEFRDYPYFGVVLQAYLRDGDRDAAEMVEYARRRGTPLWIRLVKGAYWDTETVHSEQRGWPCPVWRQKWQSDACYERMSRTLLAAHRHIHTALGSHNVRSLAHGLALKRAWEIPGWAFETQMLYGMGDPIKRALADMGERCRVYTPYGQLLPGMAYLIRRLLENTANESFLRSAVDENTPKDALLEAPEKIGRRTPPTPEPVVIKFEFENPIMDPFVNVPDTDFSRESNRQALLAALGRAKQRLGREVPLVIGGERIVTGQWRESLNPSRPAEVIGRVAQADRALAERAADEAFEAYRDWRRVDPAERAGYLFRVAEIMQRERFDLAALICLECGKPWREADADVSESIDFCNYYGKEMIRISENVRRRDVPGETNEYIYAPRGVVAVISPWNFPLAILTGMTSAALVTGNAVIMKPAEPAMVICSRLMEMFEEAALPAGVLNYVPGPGGVVGETLVTSPKVAMIAFTGSQTVGCRINALAAQTPTSQPALKKVIAEMGGKNATIVDSDADLDEAVKGVVYSAFGYAGQKCSASSRCIVLEGIYDRFVERLVEAARSISVGEADDCGTFLPPVVDAKAYKSIREYIEIGKKESHCALDPDVSDLVQRTGGGYYIGPTIFTDVSPDARIAREEIFGPVLAVIKAADIDTAIQIFNNTDFALTGGIFSRSPRNIEKARAECECGNFYINRKISGALVDLQPFGGFKMSGIGSKAGGPDYLIQFCEPRTITENTMRRGFAPSETPAVASV